MARREIKVSERTSKQLDDIAKWMEQNECYRPSRAGAAARAISFAWEVMQMNDQKKLQMPNGGVSDES